MNTQAFLRAGVVLALAGRIIGGQAATFSAAGLFGPDGFGGNVGDLFRGKNPSSDGVPAERSGPVIDVGIKGYNKANTASVLWKRGDYTGAEKEATKLAEKATKGKNDDKGKDALIYRLEEGTILLFNNKPEQSIKALEAAERRVDENSAKAKTSLSDEAVKGLLNPSHAVYRGRAYDGILLNTYKALNYLRLGQGESAKVELTRASQRQIDAVEANKKRIEREAEELEKNKDKDKIEAAEKDEKLNQQLAEVYGSLEQLKPYANYENPFTVYLDGLVTMAIAASLNDNEYARKAFERAVGFEPANPYLKADLDAMEGVVRGTSIAPTTYVIFETGSAPIRETVRFDLPVPGVETFFAASFPKLRFDEDFVPNLEVTHGSATDKTALVASIDAVIGREFKNDLPGVKARTLSWAAGKAAAGSFAPGPVKLLFIGQQALFNEADLRTWHTLPKEVQVCRIPTPEDRKVVVTVPGGAHRSEIVVQEGHFNLIHVRSVNSRTPLVISQIKLK
jgi:hypothetical protein